MTAVDTQFQMNRAGWVRVVVYGACDADPTGPVWIGHPVEIQDRPDRTAHRCGLPMRIIEKSATSSTHTVPCVDARPRRFLMTVTPMIPAIGV